MLANNKFVPILMCLQEHELIRKAWI